MKFAVRIVDLVDRLPDSRATRVIGGQLLRSGTSVGANYRAACRAKSRADFISKMGTVEEECDEAIYWMELLILAGKVKEASPTELINEATSLLAITVASIKRARSRK